MGGVIAFISGLIFGSFLNVVIIRFDDWVSILKTRSHCPECRTQLTWWDMIPVISFLTLRGQCRYCQKPIKWQYPLVELLTAVLFAAGYWLLFQAHSFELWRAVTLAGLYIVVVGCLITIFFHDLYEMMIPDSLGNVLVLAAAVFGFLYYPTYLEPVYGALVGGLPIALLVYAGRGRWMGEGDIRVAVALGLLTGFPGSVVFFVTAFLIGGFYGVITLLLKQAKLRTAVPFAPFLITGGLIALFYGSQIAEWYLGRLGIIYF